MSQAREVIPDLAQLVKSQFAEVGLEITLRPVDTPTFTRLVFHFPADDQRRQLNAFCEDVLPRLRSRFG